MNKTALKNFVVRARRKLIEDVIHKAYELGISKDITQTSDQLDGGSIIVSLDNGKVIDKRETEHRAKLIDEIRAKGYEQLMEEVAYTWFNRFIALRFMEVNDYLPTGIRVLSSLQEGKKEPDIIQQALTVDLDLDKSVVYELQDNGSATRLYKYLLIKQCNQLGQIMPGVFEPIADYTELLLPDNLLGEGAIIRDLVDSIDEYDWKIELSSDQLVLEAEKGEHGIEIIGWLYQYYISEKKDEVFAGLKKNIKITKENIPAATQLFTPKWIVKYMIENSLGRLWVESHPNEELKKNWKYYLEEAEQEPEVHKQLDELKNPNLKPEDIKVLDPAMGSGHILVYAYDVLHDIYLSAGYAEKEVPSLILEKNLYGLEIDDRAGQLASFALYMKARSRNKKIFNDMPELNLCSIQESNGIPKDAIDYLVDPQESEIEKYMHQEEAEYLVDVFHDAKEYGSILEVKEVDFDALEKRVKQIISEPPGSVMELKYRNVIADKMPALVKQGRIMSIKYDVVCTNPPYMSKRNMNKLLVKQVNDIYKKSSIDLYSVFIERCSKFCSKQGWACLITQHSWMFLSRLEEFREMIMNNHVIDSMIHLGSRAFDGIGGEVVQTSSFILRKITSICYKGNFIRLIDFQSAVDKEKHFFNSENKYKAKLRNFMGIPGKPIAYWVSKKIINLYNTMDSFDNYAITRAGMITGNNELFVKLWFEISHLSIGFQMISRDSAKQSKCKWFPYNKGGVFRKWYGNNEHVVNWWNDGWEIRNYRDEKGSYPAHAFNEDFIFKKCVTWTSVSMYNFSARFSEQGFLFDAGGSCAFTKEDNTLYFLAFMNSKLSIMFLSIQNPTMNFQKGNMSNLPVLMIKDVKLTDIINKTTIGCLQISIIDWDSFETSWDFQTHPLITQKDDSTKIGQAYQNWSSFAEAQFNQLKQNEEELNRIFIDIYGLQDELTPEVEDKDITISKADRERDIKSFLSYAVGCTFGRYSLDHPGLIYAGGDFSDKFRQGGNTWEVKTDSGWIPSSIAIEGDNIIPIVDDDYFENDIVKKVVDFLKAAFGEETLEENLNYIAETLGSKAGETARQTIRRYFIKDFYKDHARTYKKRPIYWLFDSGKENGFKALIYMHRYDPQTVARVRTDYLHKLQKNYEAVINQLDIVINSQAPEREKAAAKKRKERIRKQLEECRLYDQAIAHVANQRIDIDLDDGVKVNYGRFQEVAIPQGEGRKPLKADLLAKI